MIKCLGYAIQAPFLGHCCHTWIIKSSTILGIDYFKQVYFD